MEIVAAPRRRGRRVPDGDMPGGSPDPVAAIGWECLPLGKAELSPLLPRWTRTTSSAITRARRAVLGDRVAASGADSSRTRQRARPRTLVGCIDVYHDRPKSMCEGGRLGTDARHPPPTTRICAARKLASECSR